MNTTTKKFLSAVMTAAIVFSQASAPVAAATVRGTSSASQSDTVKSSRKNFNNSSNFNKVDANGYAYAYGYYTIAASNKNRSNAYVGLLKAMRNRKSSIVLKGYGPIMSDTDAWDIAMGLKSAYPDLYYLRGVKTSNDGKNITVTFSYRSEEEIKKNQKEFDAYLDAFDEFLEENNATTTKQFLTCANAYIAKTISYNYDAKGKHSKAPNCDDVCAILDGKAVCEGYVAVFRYLCMTHGLPVVSRSLVSSTGSGHSIAAVPVNNIWYNFDPTGCKTASLQFTTDKAYIAAKNERMGETYKFRSTTFTCDGNPLSIESSESTSNSIPECNAYEGYTFKDLKSEVEDIERFKRIINNNIASALDGDYNAVRFGIGTKFVGNEDKILSKIKQMKKDGLITYKSADVYRDGKTMYIYIIF